MVLRFVEFLIVFFSFIVYKFVGIGYFVFCLEIVFEIYILMNS